MFCCSLSLFLSHVCSPSVLHFSTLKGERNIRFLSPCQLCCLLVRPGEAVSGLSARSHPMPPGAGVPWGACACGRLASLKGKDQVQSWGRGAP